MRARGEGSIDLEAEDQARYKPSNFAMNRRQQDMCNQAKAQLLREELEQFYKQPASVIQSTTVLAAQQISELEAKRVLTETWILIDMDMFYAAIELLERPDLTSSPVAVCSNNMITAANYVAREFGIKSGTPVYQGRSRCRDLVLLESNMEKYKQVAKEVRDVLGEYDEKMETKGLDEAYLLVTQTLIRRKMNTDEGKCALAEEIREKVFKKTGLTSSAGIACNKLLSKICSEVKKPNGQFYLPPIPAEIRRFMFNRKVRDITGVGKVTGQLLTSIGIFTCKQIFEEQLKIYVGFPQNVCTFLFNSALGIGTTDHSERVEDQRSFSACKSFPPTNDLQVLEEHLQAFAEQISSELKAKSAYCRCVSLFHKTENFQEQSRSETSLPMLNTGEELHRVAMRLLRTIHPIPLIRTLGLRVTHLHYPDVKPTPGQLKQTQLTPATAPPQMRPRKRKPVVEEDLFQSIMSHSMLPNKKLAPGALLQKHKCPVCNQQ